MRRSLRKMDPQEIGRYHESEQLFTVESLEEARQRLVEQGLDPSSYCFFTWMRDGVRYYRVWEDKRLKEGIVKAVPFGEVAARLKRAEAEKLYTVAKRYHGSRIKFFINDGLIEVADAITGQVKLAVSVPIVGGSLLLHQREWNEQQAAHFINAILLRGLGAEAAFDEAESLQVTSKV
jgi:hypothetical protein